MSNVVPGLDPGPLPTGRNTRRRRPYWKMALQRTKLWQLREAHHRLPPFAAYIRAAAGLCIAAAMLTDPTALLLARLQFAFTVSFHFIFPAFSIGLASYLAVLEGLWLKTGKDAYLNLFKYWLKIFAITFAMGVVSGIVMSYQFGTNWSVFSDRAGPITGPARSENTDQLVPNW